MTQRARLAGLRALWHKRPRRWQGARQRRLAVGGAITAGWLALLGPSLVPYDPLQGDPSRIAAPPSVWHPFGMDKYGRDVLSRVVAGTRYDLCLAIAAVGLAGFIGGVVDQLLMRGIDMLLAFPSFVLALVFVAVLGPSFGVLIVALGLRFIPLYARLVRGELMAEKAKEYAQAARAIGCSEARLIWRHLLPNALGPIVTQSTMNLSWASAFWVWARSRRRLNGA
jgi:peptide/nickel transport system permease protein